MASNGTQGQHVDDTKHDKNIVEKERDTTRQGGKNEAKRQIPNSKVWVGRKVEILGERKITKIYRKSRAKMVPRKEATGETDIEDLQKSLQSFSKVCLGMCNMCPFKAMPLPITASADVAGISLLQE